MRSPKVVLLTLWVIPALLASAEQPVEKRVELPQIVYTSLDRLDPGLPVFVAAEAAIHADGEIDRSLFPLETERAVLRDLLGEPAEEGCVHLEVVYWDVIAPSRDSLEEGAKNSALVFEAVVVGRTFGFHGFEAGQLLAVKPVDWIKGELPRDHIYYVFYPVGTFRAGPYDICKVDRRYPPAPELGDHLILLVPKIEPSAAPFLDVVDSAGVIVISKNQEVRLPREYRGHGMGDLNPQDLRSVLRRTPVFSDKKPSPP